MAQMQLSNSDQQAIVDDDLLEHLLQFRWRLMNTGYVACGYVKGEHNTFKAMHRFVLDLPNSRKPVVDHINRDKLDNRRSNLRITDQTINAMNSGDYTKYSECPKGVYLLPNGSYRAMIRTAGQLRHLGVFTTEAEAFSARQEAERMFWETTATKYGD